MENEEIERSRELNGWVDRNDPLNYVGEQYKFLEEDGGFKNNVRTKLQSKPTRFPLDEVWNSLLGSSYHKTKWVPADNRREDAASRRRLARDPNHPIWSPENGILRWWYIRISLLGSDEEGRQWISLRKGQSEPIYFRIGRIIEVYFKGKKVKLDQTEEE